MGSVVVGSVFNARSGSGTDILAGANADPSLRTANAFDLELVTRTAHNSWLWFVSGLMDKRNAYSLLALESVRRRAKKALSPGNTPSVNRAW